MAGKEKLIENIGKVNLSDRFVHFAACLEDFCPRKTALRISSVYVIIGALWILLSDKILHGTLADKQWIAIINMLKGWAYVLATGILLFWTTLKALDRLRSINQALLKNYEELAAVYEELAASEQELQKHMEVLEESEERYRLVEKAQVPKSAGVLFQQAVAARGGIGAAGQKQRACRKFYRRLKYGIKRSR